MNAAPVNATLFLLGLLAAIAYCAYTAHLWRMFAQFYAKYCYFPDYLREQFPASQLAVRPDPASEAGVRAIKSSMPQIHRDLREHTGSARGLNPAVWWVQRVFFTLSITLLY